MIRVLLVDDHHLVRAGMTSLLDAEPDLTVVGEAPDGSAVLAEVARVQPDVILMDLSMPGVDGIEATRAVMTAEPDSRVVVLTSFSDRDRVGEAMSAGAIGYLLKDSDPADLLAAIRAAARGEVPLDPRIAGALLPQVRREARGVDRLSGREVQVLRLVAQGLANKQIARALGISERTVKAHLGSVFKALDVADRTSAALWARDHLDAG